MEICIKQRTKHYFYANALNYFSTRKYKMLTKRIFVPNTLKLTRNLCVTRKLDIIRLLRTNQF